MFDNMFLLVFDFFLKQNVFVFEWQNYKKDMSNKENQKKIDISTECFIYLIATTTRSGPRKLEPSGSLMCVTGAHLFFFFNLGHLAS